jgi:hypothetical protein
MPILAPSTLSGVKFDQLLTNISLQFAAAPEGYLADQILPPVPVVKESAAFWVYDKSKLDTPDSKRAPRSNYNRIDWAVTTDTYLAEQYGLEGEIDDEERKNAASPLDLDVDTTEIVTDMVLNNRELRVQALVMATANVTSNTTLSGTSQWSDLANSDPLGDVKTGRTTMYTNAPGYVPNVFLMGYLVFEGLKIHPDIKEIVKYTERAIITRQILAAVFEVDEVLIGKVIRRSSKEGQTDAFTDVWGKDALLFYREDRPSLKRASFGYQFRENDLRVFRYREDKRDTDVIRVSEKGDEKLIAATLGYLIKAAVA